MANAHEQTRWVNIGNGIFEHGFLYPYKINFFVPYGVRDIEEIKQGLFPMKFELLWLPNDSTHDEVEKIFSKQLEENFNNPENYRLSKNLINLFLKKLPQTKRHDQWVFIYFPDEGTRLYIEEEKIHHIAGAELNRVLIQSWLNKTPVLTANLLNRLLKLKD